MRIGITGLAVAIALASCASAAQAQQMKLTPQIGLGTLDQATPDPTFETRTLGALAGLKDGQAFTGDAFLLRKDRGPHTGRYAALVIPVAGRSGNGTAFGRMFPTLAQYQLVGAARLGPLPEVDILGVHYIKVRPDRREAFDKFVTDKLNPAVGNLRPDLRFLYYKATEGPAAGSYVTIIAVTKASRDKYWPNGSDSDDLKAAFTPAVKALATELQTYLVDGTFGTGMTAAVYESKEWADWVVVAGGKRP